MPTSRCDTISGTRFDCETVYDRQYAGVTLPQLKILLIAFVTLVALNAIFGRGPAVGGKEWWFIIAGAVCFFARQWHAVIRQQSETEERPAQ
jgi:hypothetical protein